MLPTCYKVLQINQFSYTMFGLPPACSCLLTYMLRCHTTLKAPVESSSGRLALHPGLVSPWAFFNPSANEMHVGSAAPPPSSVGSGRQACGCLDGTLRSLSGPVGQRASRPVVRRADQWSCMHICLFSFQQCLLVQCFWKGAARACGTCHACMPFLPIVAAT